MPNSTSAGKPKVAKWLKDHIKNEECSVIDLGCGKGTYGNLLKDVKCKKMAVDAVDYCEKYKLLDIYDRFYCHDISDIVFLDSLGRFDIAILGDVLEHLYYEDARKVLDCLENHCDIIMVAVPFRSHQWGVFNHWENHIQEDLTEEIFKERYPEFEVFSLHKTSAKPYNGGAWYGYYIWEKENKS